MRQGDVRAAGPGPDRPVRPLTRDDQSPLVLGADDFALRKGHVYGTVLAGIETRCPVDLLAERSAEAFRA